MQPSGPPRALTHLLSAAAGAEPEAARADFVAAQSDILLRTCRSLARDRDAAMDGYVYALEALREDDYRRLRAYVPDGKTRFTTWLVVVTRRLVLDHFRRRYGRLAQSYGSIPGVVTQIGGSVQSLPRGETLVSFGTAGRVEEYDATGRVMWRIAGNAGYVFRARRIKSLCTPGVGMPR